MTVADLTMLVCAVLAALAAGVLIGYGVCLSMFALFRVHAGKATAKRPVSVGAAVEVEG